MRLAHSTQLSYGLLQAPEAEAHVVTLDFDALAAGDLNLLPDWRTTV